MSPGLPKLAFLAFFAVQCVLWSNSRYADVSYSSALTRTTNPHLKRGLPGLLHAPGHDARADDECAPLSIPIDLQCAHIQEVCEEGETALNIPYLRTYFCADPTVRPAIFAGYIVWIIFLFSTLGISASDFFCPNLATISGLLGLDEDVAGVTILAFGNGSPDVFSTFSAMRANSGSLAIGELLGAASFIVSCVVGSMCIIKEFRVEKTPFLRDVGFFTAAVILLFIILYDHIIKAWEAWALVALYILYVFIVVIGSWWDRRRNRRYQKELLIRSEYRDDDIPEPSLLHFDQYTDDEPPQSESTTLAPPATRTRAHSSPAAPPRLGIQTELPLRPQTHNPSPVTEHPTPTNTMRSSQMPSFSLVGALEFRQVIASLQTQSAAAALSAFDTPVSPYPGGHYHRRSLPRSRSSRPSLYGSEIDPFDSSAGVPLSARSPRLETPLTLTDDSRSVGGLGPRTRPPSSGTHTPVPAIAHTPASPISEESSVDVEGHTYTPLGARQRVMHAIAHTYHVLFPTLHNFRAKSVLGMIASVLAAPAVLALTVTLPVVVEARGGAGAEEKNRPPEGRLVDFEEEGIERVLTAEDEVQEEMHVLQFNKWLMAAQCALGPLLCVSVLFAGAKNEAWLLAATSIGGLAAALLVCIFADRGDDPAARTARCCMGFFVSVVWIMAIADEVVNVLKTVGFIFGLSDAIIGLTIFAVGNSLADFVANISVAAFAPVMGFSACFGGPMLNILLGVGASGVYITRTQGAEYTLQFTTTLIVSAVGLLTLLAATLVVVPLNGFVLTRRWGICLIVGYVLIMATNLVVEIKKK